MFSRHREIFRRPIVDAGAARPPPHTTGTPPSPPAAVVPDRHPHCSAADLVAQDVLVDVMKIGATLARPSNGAQRTALTSLRAGAVEHAFRWLRRFRPARERVTLGEFNDRVEREHVARYRLAAEFCRGRRVADIACGTGYGTRLLATVAASVDAYDKEPLCGNRLIDLEREGWGETYDVIVSLETIEHLANPAFFLENARRTTKQLIVSTPIGEFRGYNPHHKQVWTLAEFQALIESRFSCDYYVQDGETIHRQLDGRERFVIAVGTPRVAASSRVAAPRLDAPFPSEPKRTP